ncbi:hypothetical protein [Marinomonas ostreistagni]|uniref:hypothetical protein n=1 Tax=Marinomonas ostreistagni TaxID=359209 RepID=UPI001950E66E|nr:hypothetical protein [Marinomonas ostreistagni]MBM6549694.1 hypothetical protein [Marinomonas ostreistagni]
MAETELPNFELGIGGGIAKDIPMFNLDLTINMPFTQVFTGQLNLDSEYVFNDPDYEDYAMSEFNGIGFYRMSSGRVGGGVGVLEKKARDDEFDTERTAVMHLLGAYYFQDVTLDANYQLYEDEFDGVRTLRAGAIWYPDTERSLAVYHERYDDSHGWRIEGNIQPEKYDQKLAFGAVISDREDLSFPYVGLEVTYFFDRVYSLKQRDRAFH